MIIKNKTTGHSNTKRTLFAIYLLAATIVSVGLLNPTAARAASPVEGMVTSFANQVLGILAADRSVSQQKKQFGSVFLHYANIGAIARFTLGKYARRIKPIQNEEFQTLLGDYIIELFVVKLRGTQSEGIEILKITERKKDTDYLVKSEIKIRKIPGYSDAPIPVKWRIKTDENGDLKLNDINIGGFWLAQEQRSTFVDIISSNNGRVSALLDYLRKETGG